MLPIYNELTAYESQKICIITETLSGPQNNSQHGADMVSFS